MTGKIYHFPKSINRDGGVYALCAAKSQVINLRKASWTNRREGVTCPRCKKRLAEAAK